MHFPIFSHPLVRTLFTSGLLLAASGCPKQPSTPPGTGTAPASTAVKAAEPRPIVYGFTDSPDTLLPYRRANEVSRHLQELIFDGLVNRTQVKKDGRQEFDWALAVKYVEKSDEERKLFSIPLREGVHWHDGHDFTAQDVAFSWRALAESKAPMAGWLRAFIVDVVAVDKHLVQMKLHCERSEEVVKELLSSFKILPAKAKIGNQTQELPADLSGGGLSDDFAFHPVGTGPFKLKDDFQPGSARLEANLDYMRGPPVTRTLFGKRIEDASLLVKNLAKGDVNFVADVSPGSFRQLDSASLKSARYFPYQFHAIFYNIERGSLRNLAFRRAVTAATNKEELAEKLFPGKSGDLSEFINKSLFPHNYEQVVAEPAAYGSSLSYNVDQAKEFLRTSKQRPSFSLLISSQKDGEAVKQLAEAYQQQMRNVGIEVRILDESESRYMSLLRPREGAGDSSPEYEAALVLVSGLDHFYDIRSLFQAGGKRRTGLPPLLEPVARGDRELAAQLMAFGGTISFDRIAEITRRIHRAVDSATPFCPLFSLPRQAYFPKTASRVNVHPEVGFGDVRMWSFGE
jgi:peptide/nickel transport system substrate-binding protein